MIGRVFRKGQSEINPELNKNIRNALAILQRNSEYRYAEHMAQIAEQMEADGTPTTSALLREIGERSPLSELGKALDALKSKGALRSGPLHGLYVSLIGLLAATIVEVRSTLVLGALVGDLSERASEFYVKAHREADNAHQKVMKESEYLERFLTKLKAQSPVVFEQIMDGQT